MWKAVLVSDLDGNGYKDIIAGNAGLNFKLKALEGHPVKLYLDDFDANGKLDPVIFLENLPVPSGLNSRIISDPDENDLLIISNDDKAYPFKLPDL